MSAGLWPASLFFTLPVKNSPRFPSTRLKFFTSRRKLLSQSKLAKALLYKNGVSTKKSIGGHMAETKIQLTEEQKQQLKEAIGQEHSEIKVETIATVAVPLKAAHPV